MLIFVMVSVSRFGRCSVRNVVGGYNVRVMGSCLFNSVMVLLNCHQNW